MAKKAAKGISEKDGVTTIGKPETPKAKTTRSQQSTRLPSERKPVGSSYIGVDPGGSGAIAAIDEDGLIFAVHKNDATERDVWEFVKDVKAQTKGECFAVIERVGAMPGQGVHSMFVFGQSYGFLRGLLIAAEIPFVEVSPAKWQQALGCPTRGKLSKTQHKNRLKAKAQQRWPHVKMTLAIADALLLAEYARRNTAIPGG